MRLTPNKITALRVAVGFAAVSLFGRDSRANLAAILLTVTAIALDGLDGHIARRKCLATPIGAQVDILGDRMLENVYFTYFAVVGMVSFWLPVLFFARGAVTDFLRSLATRSGHAGWSTDLLLKSWPGRTFVASRWSRGVYATLKCLCFCYLGFELALTRGTVALAGELTVDTLALIRFGAHILSWITTAFCFLRGAPLIFEGCRYFLRNFESPGIVSAAAGTKRGSGMA